MKAGAKQHPWIILENIFSAIAVMHIKIDDGHTFKPLHLESIGGSCGNIVEITESHGAVSLRMVARRTHSTEGGSEIVVQHQVNPAYNSPRRPSRGIQGLRHHNGIVIQRQDALSWRTLEQVGHIIRVMHPFKMHCFDEGGFVGYEYKFEPGTDQLVMDCVKSLRSFRMMVADFMQQAVRVCDVCNSHVSTPQDAYNARISDDKDHHI